MAFWPQPEGNGLETAPLVVALLGQTPSLADVVRLNWHCFQPIRNWKNSVNRPKTLPLACAWEVNHRALAGPLLAPPFKG